MSCKIAVKDLEKKNVYMTDLQNFGLCTIISEFQADYTRKFRTVHLCGNCNGQYK